MWMAGIPNAKSWKKVEITTLLLKFLARRLNEIVSVFLPLLFVEKWGCIIKCGNQKLQNMEAEGGVTIKTWMQSNGNKCELIFANIFGPLKIWTSLLSRILIFFTNAAFLFTFLTNWQLPLLTFKSNSSQLKNHKLTVWLRLHLLEIGASKKDFKSAVKVNQNWYNH